MEMIVNSLPTRTWNHLGINDAAVTTAEGFCNLTPAVSGMAEGIDWNPAAASAVWENMKTGMGPNVSVLTKDAVIGSVCAAKDTQTAAPVVLHYAYGNDVHAISRLHIHAAAGSRLSVVLLLDAKEQAAGGTAALQTEIHAEHDASVKVYIAQLLGPNFKCLHDIGGICDANASIELIKLELGAGAAYAGAYIDLLGNKSQFETSIGYHVRSGQILDMNYVAEHHGKKTSSLMDISGTLENGAKKAFRGTIDFPKGCKAAKGTETENVLLMGDDVINQSIPLILCKEEDVEGNHGASIGRLDDKVLFYLGSRGIDKETAQKIIARSRIEAICSKIPCDSVREAVHHFED